MPSTEFPCFQVSRSENGQLRHTIETIGLRDLPAGNVVIHVEWSSLNYKDALACQSHPGVAGELPHIPGIDAAGEVESSDDSRFAAGDRVLVTGYELGAPAWGGWSEYIRVPSDWVVRLPSTLTAREAMVIGTAGFTSAQCVRELQTNGVEPSSGPIIVTGATGGVGCCAVRLLSQLGYEVHAVTGKSAKSNSLIALGAKEVHGREILADNPKRPMMKSEWAGGIDTVGGSMLDALLKSTKIGGCVAACGLVAGDKLNLTVYPFILRGVKLVGVTSSSCPRPAREWIWSKLASDWKIELPDEFVNEVSLEGLATAVERIRSGDNVGRVVVKVA